MGESSKRFGKRLHSNTCDEVRKLSALIEWNLTEYILNSLKGKNILKIEQNKWQIFFKNKFLLLLSAGKKSKYQSDL